MDYKVGDKVLIIGWPIWNGPAVILAVYPHAVHVKPTGHNYTNLVNSGIIYSTVDKWAIGSFKFKNIMPYPTNYLERIIYGVEEEQN
jgi:hypothetical protein